MNMRQIIGSAIVSAGVGAILGLCIAQIAPPRFFSKEYQELPSKYPLIGAISAGIIGGCQCAIWQLKKQQDQEAA